MLDGTDHSAYHMDKAIEQLHFWSYVKKQLAVLKGRNVSNVKAVINHWCQDIQYKNLLEEMSFFADPTTLQFAVAK